MLIGYSENNNSDFTNFHLTLLETQHILFHSDLEAKDLILNTLQGSPREETTNSPPERHSPLQTRPVSSQKYPQRPPGYTSSVLTPPSSTVPEDDFSDSNGTMNYPPPEYPSVFLPNFNGEDYYQHQEMFYPYSDPELAQHPLHVIGQQRPFSASSSSCSSSESDHPVSPYLNLFF